MASNTSAFEPTIPARPMRDAPDDARPVADRNGDGRLLRKIFAKRPAIAIISSDSPPPGTASASDRAHDPLDAMNGARYHTGRRCTERGCYEPAGTAWGPHRCQRHNAEELDRIARSLAEFRARVG